MKHKTKEKRRKANLLSQKKWREDNKDYNKKRLKEYYLKNKEKENERKRSQYRVAHPIKDKKILSDTETQQKKLEKMKYGKKYREDNKTKIKDYFKRNKEKLRLKAREYERNRLRNDKVYKLKHNIKTLIRNSFNFKKFKKNRKTNEILGCSFEDFKVFLESKFEPWMNWDNYGKYNGELN